MTAAPVVDVIEYEAGRPPERQVDPITARVIAGALSVVLRVTRSELRTDRGGAGRSRGGVGSVRETQLRAAAHVSLEGDGHRHPPRGAFGGGDGTPGEAVLVTADGEEVRLPSKLQSLLGRPGDVIRTVSPCGGGYGDPLERDPQRVADDVLDGILSVESARSRYGVVVDPVTGRSDEVATPALRAAMARVSTGAPA